MSGHALAQPQNVKTSQENVVDTVSLQHRYTPQAKPTTLPKLLYDVALGTFAEPRFGYDFSRVPAHTDKVKRTQPLLRTGTMVQRYPVNGDADSAPCSTCSDEESTPISASAGLTAEPTSPAPEATSRTAAPEPEEESAAPVETMAPALLVEDSATELAPGQMRKSEFLAQLRAEVTRAAESAMAGTGRTTADCPYLDFWFGYYSLLDSTHIERAIHRYAPETRSATLPREYITIITGRVRRSVETWIRTGEVTGVPEGLSVSLPGETPAGSVGSAPAASSPVMAKACDGGIRPADNPQAIQAELGQGRPLDSGVRSRMESAFGMDFSHVCTHTNTTAARLSNRMNARAFTIGKHVAFGAGEYQPGTLVGDALIAHELAHVAQQSGASDSVAPMQTGEAGYNMLENDADKSAIGAIASLWVGAKETISGIAQNAIPHLKSGLCLSRCKKDPTVDQIDIIDSTAGAIGGYSPIQGNSDLNVPGPFNDSVTGEVKNVHQIHFHLDNGNSSDLTPTRQIQRSAWTAGTEHKKPPDEILPPGVYGPPAPGGFDGVIVGPDGPGEHEIQRPTADKISIADAPGHRALSASQYPFIYRAHFILTVANNSGTDVARTKYDVRIEKRNAGDIPNTENKITATEKKDLVRDRDLT